MFADINECFSVCDPCLESGTCVDEVNGYSCICIAGFTGSLCETSKSKGSTISLIISSVYVTLCIFEMNGPCFHVVLMII